jgi:lipopolysaccharide/colanic/teichoic acid biosynthesis glycosyltransferase
VEAAVCLLGLAVISPLLLLALLAVRLSSRGPVLFRQVRAGRGGAPFTIFKLRTMRIDAGGPEVTGRDDTRITPIGRWLRRSKLDEVPQLWNVVRGDMSLVGPRPEVPRYVDLANPLWRRILEARPGITDPLTLRLKDEETLMPAAEAERERFYLETLQPLKLRASLEYLARRSAWSDLGVVVATVIGILRRDRGADPAEILRSGRI